MAYDKHSNFAYSTVAIAPSPATSGTTLSIQSGDVANFPLPPFNCTAWPPSVAPILANAEIVRVTQVVGSQFTIVRAQEGSNGQIITNGWQISNAITVKVLTDIENSIKTTAISMAAALG